MPYLYGQLFNTQLENSTGNPASGGTPLGRIYLDITNTAHSIPKYFDGSTYANFGAPIITSNSTSVVTFNTTGDNETIYKSSAFLLVSATITLPTTTSIGQILRYVVNSGITTVTLVGTIVAGNPTLTTLAQYGSVAWQAINTTGSFVRIQ